MPSFLETLRWFCVLPAAVIGKTLVHFILGVTLRMAGFSGAGAVDSSLAFSLKLVFLYLLPAVAFVVAGAMLAPRRVLVAAIVLTVLGISTSLMTHVLGQHLAGNRVGSTNYLHLAAETAGLLAGIAVIAWRNRKAQPVRQ